MVVVGLAVIVADGIAVLVEAQHTARVIGASVAVLLIFRRVVPGVIRLFLTIPGDELNDGIVAKPSGLQEVGVQLR